MVFFQLLMPPNTKSFFYSGHTRTQYFSNVTRYEAQVETSNNWVVYPRPAVTIGDEE